MGLKPWPKGGQNVLCHQPIVMLDGTNMDPQLRLQEAIKNGDLKCISDLVAGHLQPDVACLLQAIKQQAYEILKLLAKSSANLDQIARTGQTPLSQALRLQDMEAVRILLAAGASATKPCAFGAPLAYASLWGMKEAIPLLLKHGAGIKGNK